MTEQNRGGALAGRTAIVTGAANGIGLAIARRFAAAGARLVAVDRAAEQLAEAVREIGGDAVPVAADVTDTDAPDRIVEACLARHGKLDILVNNAGIGGGVSVGELPEEDWRRHLEVN